MPRFVCAALLASSALWTNGAAADPLCVTVAFTGSLGALSPVRACVPYPGPVSCAPLSVDTGALGVVLLICGPAV